jgi:hypothetical protein
VKVQEKILSEAPGDADRFGIPGSNSVVLELGARFETVERPLEATLYEALYRLRSQENGVIGVLRGEGEGDLSSDAELGFSGCRGARDRGYRLRSLSRRCRDSRRHRRRCCCSPAAPAAAGSVAALERYPSGAAAAALLEPGRAASSRCSRAGASEAPTA